MCSSNTTWREMITRLSLVVRRVPKEYARMGSRGKFVSTGGSEVWVAQTAKHAEGGVLRVDALEKIEGCVAMASTTRAAVEKEIGRVKGLDPERVRHGRMGEKGACDVVQCAEYALGSAVLR